MTVVCGGGGGGDDDGGTDGKAFGNKSRFLFPPSAFYLLIVCNPLLPKKHEHCTQMCVWHVCLYEGANEYVFR